MTTLQIKKAEYLPLGEKGYHITWDPFPQNITQPSEISEYGFGRYGVMLQEKEGMPCAFELTPERNGQALCFDINDPEVERLEANLLLDSAFLRENGEIHPLKAGDTLRTAYEQNASTPMLTVKPFPDKAILLELKLAASTGDLTEFLRLAESFDSIILWPRSRERCYLITKALPVNLRMV